MELFKHLEASWTEIGAKPLLEAIASLQTLKKSALPVPEWPFFKLAHLCCQTAGGNPEQADYPMLAWAAYYLAAHLLDQIADGEVEPSEQGKYATLAAACMATAGQFLEKMDQAGVDAGIAQAIRKDFYQSILISSSGQMVSLQPEMITLAESRKAAAEKTGEVFALACRTGARLAGCSEDCVHLYGEYGLHLGIMIQIGDDWHGIAPVGGEKSDFLQGFTSLPLAYYMGVSSPAEQKTMRYLVESSKQNPIYIQEAAHLLIHSGALYYLAAEARLNRIKAEEALLQAASKQTASLEEQGRHQGQADLLTLLQKAFPY